MSQTLLVCVQPVIAGFNHTDCFSLCWPEEIHQIYRGNMKHLLDKLELELSASQLTALADELNRTQQFPGLLLPSNGLSTPKMYAKQLANMFRCLPVPLLSLADGWESASMYIIAIEG